MREQQNSIRAAVEAVGNFRQQTVQENENVAVEEEESQEESESTEVESDEEESEETESEEEEESDETFEITHNGEKHNVTFEELQRLASAGFDYTKKSQELSERVKTEAKKLSDEQTQELQKSRQQYIEAAEIVEKLYNNPIATDEQLQKLLDEGETDEYTRLKHQEEKRRQMIDAVIAGRTKALKDQQVEQQENFKKYAAQQAEILQREVPELKKPENVKQLVEHAKNLGYSEEELSSAADARALKVLWQSMQYQKLAKGGIPKKKPKSPKVTKSKRANPSKQSQDRTAINNKREKLRATNSIRDAASLIGEYRKR